MTNNSPTPIPYVCEACKKKHVYLCVGKLTNRRHFCPECMAARRDEQYRDTLIRKYKREGKDAPKFMGKKVLISRHNVRMAMKLCMDRGIETKRGMARALGLKENVWWRMVDSARIGKDAPTLQVFVDIVSSKIAKWSGIEQTNSKEEGIPVRADDWYSRLEPPFIYDLREALARSGLGSYQSHPLFWRRFRPWGFRLPKKVDNGTAPLRCDSDASREL